jgi:serine phosphatase RsbU (regulator of sigma subunit)
METRVFERIHNSLLEKRQALATWLYNTPAPKKQARLGPASEQAVQAHLQVLDAALARTEDKTLGICTVCHGYVGRSLLEMDYTASVCLDHFSAEERRSLESELELAQVVQRALLPARVAEIPGMELAAFSRAAQIVGGDYYDFLQFRDGAHGVVIADVAGHGVSAGMLMASVQTALHALIPENDSPAEVAQRLNRLFRHNIRFTTFVTLFLGRWDRATQTLEYCNAGHNSPLVFRKRDGEDGAIAWLQPTGAAIGLVEDFPYETGRVTLASRDVTLLYTDGVTEATNLQLEEFGQERLAELVSQKPGLSSEGLVREIQLALQEFAGGQPLADDTTIVVCKIKSDGVTDEQLRHATIRSES